MLRASSSRGSVSWLSRLAARNRRVLLKLVLQKLAGAENFGVALYRLLNAQSVVIARLSLLVVAARGEQRFLRRGRFRLKFFDHRRETGGEFSGGLVIRQSRGIVGFRRLRVGVDLLPASQIRLRIVAGAFLNHGAGKSGGRLLNFFSAVVIFIHQTVQSAKTFRLGAFALLQLVF